MRRRLTNSLPSESSSSCSSSSPNLDLPAVVSCYKKGQGFLFREQQGRRITWLIPILTFILLMSSSACAFLGASNFTSQKEVMDSVLHWVQSNNQAVLAKENKTEYVKFAVRIPNRPVNGRYSLAFTLEPAKKGLVLRKGKVVATTKTRVEVRIILDIPERIEGKKGELIPLSFVKKSRAARGIWKIC